MQLPVSDPEDDRSSKHDSMESELLAEIYVGVQLPDI
jgi:hypothetical protein